MDVGALLCRPRQPRCPACPLVTGCATAAAIAAGHDSGAAGSSSTPGALRSAVPWEALGRRPRQPAYEGSFRQRRGRVLAELRLGPRPSATLDAAALASLVDDGLAALDGPLARLP